MSDWDRCLLCGRITRRALEAEDGVCASCQRDVDQIDAERAAVYVEGLLGTDDGEDL